MQHKNELNGENIDVSTLFRLAHTTNLNLSIAKSAIEKVKASRNYIETRIAQGDVMYGVNTGFGAFSSVVISSAQIGELQKNLIRSHSVGIGEPFAKEEVRAMMVLRANTLARGHSGIRLEVIEKILEFLRHEIIPYIPCQGSVGASGDLAPLSHLALALIGEGEYLDEHNHPQPVAPLLSKHGVAPLELKAKEGLSLINGCQVMTAVGALALERALNLSKGFDIAGALSLEGLRGSRFAFDELISASRPHRGEVLTAKNLRRILTENSEISLSHEDCEKVQDAYSLRCMPAVHGAVKDNLLQAKRVLEVECNSSTDNPLVFAESGKILSCGNFHGEPVAMALDLACMAMASLGSISECRISKMINTHMSELPPFLTAQGGLNSGHMIVQVAAASLVSENKILSHPACVDSIPTSAEKEDHVSMGTIAARKFKKIVDNVEQILAMELLSGTQSLDLLLPLKTSEALEAVKAEVRKQVPYAEKDRAFYQDLRKLTELISSGVIVARCEEKTGPLEI